MNNAEAKFVLQGYRANGADADDGTFAEALEQAKRDPGLGEWFAREQAFDRAVGAKLAEITPPPDLRAAILAGGRVTAAGGGDRRRVVGIVALAAAASVALLLVAGLALKARQSQAVGDFVVGDAVLSAFHGHGDRGDATNALQWTLGQTTTKLAQPLNVDFGRLRATGCRVVTYQGRDLLEVCFNRGGSWFHCYIGRASDFPSLAMGEQPTLQEKGSAWLASWRHADHIVFVVSRSGRAELEALL
jgi:hypothetical protein